MWGDLLPLILFAVVFVVFLLLGQGGHTWCRPGMQGRCVPHCGPRC